MPTWRELVFHSRNAELQALYNMPPLAAASLFATTHSAQVPRCKAPGAGEHALRCLLTAKLQAPFCSLLHTCTRSSWHQQIHASVQHWWAFIQAPVTWSRALPCHSKFLLHVFHLLELDLLTALPSPFLIQEQHLTGLRYSPRLAKNELTNSPS